MIKRVVILIVGIGVVMLGRWLFFYDGIYSAPPVKTVDYRDLTAPVPPVAQANESRRPGSGTLLIDRGHGNLFAADDVSVLVEKVLSQGYNVEYLDLAERERDKDVSLRRRLWLADAYAVILPKSGFTLEETAVVSEFVEKGGKLIMIAEATRPSAVNSLANYFGITFQADYLYNLKENEGNFRNVFVRQFKESDLTRGLQTVVLYSTSSVGPSDWGLAYVDENTVSNLVESKGQLSPILLTQNKRILALADLTILEEPQSSAYDNNRLIANIADWLTVSERKFLLTDFPHFFRGKVTIDVSDPKFVEFGLKVKNALEKQQKTAEVGSIAGKSGDTVFLGLLSQADKVGADLKAGGISIPSDNLSVDVAGIGQVYKFETALLYLSTRDNNRSLILLADVEAGLQRLVEGLEKGEFRQWLVRSDLALSYQKPKPGETPPAMPKPSPTAIPKPSPTAIPKPSPTATPTPLPTATPTPTPRPPDKP